VVIALILHLVHGSDPTLSINQQKCGNKVNNSSILPYSQVPDGFCPFIFASGLSEPRAMEVVSNGDLLVLESGKQQVTVLFDSNGDGISGATERAVLARHPGLNHAVKTWNGYLYASNVTNVFRWKYKPGQRSSLGMGEVVVKNIPCCHHSTRSLAFDSNGTLYVQSGSGSNVDRDSTHSRICTFDITSIPQGGIDWSVGTVFADGLRNEVGITFDDTGRLWGVENGCDNLNRPDLGGDIHNDNPSEEMNLFSTPGKFYGYPYCWSQFKLPNNSTPRGTQWAHPNFMNDGIHSDNWCDNTANVVKPKWNFQAHMAPIDIRFWTSKTFPAQWRGAFVSFHGSWDRQPPVGYRVEHVMFENGLPVSSSKFLNYVGPGDTGRNWPHRPTGLAQRRCTFGDCLLVASDNSGVIISIGYNA
jgi:glucose/arabinose dehydrogenase